MERTAPQAPGQTCPIRLVHATRSSRAPAEPISAPYAQGRITHCGAFLQLEEQMMAFSEVSDAQIDRVDALDRLDALVWALHWPLMEHAAAMPRLMRLKRYLRALRAA
jgi:phage terminase large subunit-like protein